MEEVKVPSPGESISEVDIASWTVSDGDYVEIDQVIAEIDSDKATLELTATASGTISLKAEEGDTVENLSDHDENEFDEEFEKNEENLLEAQDDDDDHNIKRVLFSK